MAPTPDMPFRQLTTRLANRFPAFQPYGGEFDDVVPHLTIGVGSDAGAMHSAEIDIRSRLPISAYAASVTLLAEQASGRWRRAAVFPLGTTSR